MEDDGKYGDLACNLPSTSAISGTTVLWEIDR